MRLDEFLVGATSSHGGCGEGKERHRDGYVMVECFMEETDPRSGATLLEGLPVQGTDHC